MTLQHFAEYFQEYNFNFTVSGAHITCAPDRATFYVAGEMCFGIDISKIRYIINTHRHIDHYCENAVHFIVNDGEKSLFYALDGAWLNFEEFSAIRKTHIDVAIGDVLGNYRIFGHNNLKMVEEMKASLMPYIDRFIIGHMAETLHTDHTTLVYRMQQSGIEVAFDGFETGV